MTIQELADGLKNGTLALKIDDSHDFYTVAWALDDIMYNDIKCEESSIYDYCQECIHGDPEYVYDKFFIDPDRSANARKKDVEFDDGRTVVQAFEIQKEDQKIHSDLDALICKEPA